MEIYEKIINNNSAIMEIYKKIINSNDENKLRELLSENTHNDLILVPGCSNIYVQFNQLLIDIAETIIRFNRINMMEILLHDYNFDITCQNNSILLFCGNWGTNDMMNLLLNHSNINLSDSNNKILQNIMFNACESCNSTMINMLLEHGFDPNTNNGKYLNIVCEFNYTDIAKLLIEYGANVACRDNQALYTAIVNMNYETVVLLLQNGADMSAINRRLTNKQNNKRKEFINLLIENNIELLPWINHILSNPSN